MSSEEEDPSAETLSTVLLEWYPPSRRISPEERPQHKCPDLRSTNSTDRAEKPPSSSSARQERSLPRPPQRKEWQREEEDMAVGRSPTEQLELLEKTSAEVRRVPEYPPTRTIPGPDDTHSLKIEEWKTTHQSLQELLSPPPP